MGGGGGGVWGYRFPFFVSITSPGFRGGSTGQERGRCPQPTQDAPYACGQSTAHVLLPSTHQLGLNRRRCGSHRNEECDGHRDMDCVCVCVCACVCVFGRAGTLANHHRWASPPLHAVVLPPVLRPVMTRTKARLTRTPHPGNPYLPPPSPLAMRQFPFIPRVHTNSVPKAACVHLPDIYWHLTGAGLC